MSIILISNVAGKIPSVNQLLSCETGLGYNRVDALFYGLKVTGGVKEVVCLGESISPTTDHVRLHSMISALDHAAVAPGDRGKIPQADPVSGEWKLVDLPTPQGTIEIPKLILFKESGSLFAKWNSFNTDFLNYNPRIRLFRYSKNSSRNREYKPYFNRPSSLKMRMIGKLAAGVTKKTDWGCPGEANLPIEIDINLDEWILNTYNDPGDESTYTGVRISRKSREGIFLRMSLEGGNIKYQSRISGRFGLAIVIENPAGSGNPYKIWNHVSEFKMSAYKTEIPPDYEIGIKKIISLR